jgi:hypothetical protein
MTSQTGSVQLILIELASKPLHRSNENSDVGPGGETKKVLKELKLQYFRVEVQKRNLSIFEKDWI